MNSYSDALMVAWQLGAAESAAVRAAEIEPEHLLAGVFDLADLDVDAFVASQRDRNPDLRAELVKEQLHLRHLLATANVDLATLRGRRETLGGSIGRTAAAQASDVLHRSQASRRAFRRAEEIAATQTPAAPLLRPAHLLLGLLEVGSPASIRLLPEADARRLLDCLKRQIPTPVAEPARPTPYLRDFGRDLTAQARSDLLEPVIGRRDEIRTLARVLTQKQKANPLLVGDAGVGKTCVVEGLVQALAANKGPVALQGARVIEITVSGLLAGTRHRGDFEERIRAVIDEASASDDTILFIDEIHTLLGAGGDGASDAANIFKPALARGALRCIGATTSGEYRRHIERDPALDRRFHVVWIEEPSRDEAIAILRGVRHRFESHHGMSISDAALEAAVDLSLRYLPDARLPDKAVDLVDEACAAARLTTMSTISSWDTDVEIGSHEIRTVVARRCRIRLETLSTHGASRLLTLEEELGRRVFGQDAAVSAVANAVTAARAGLNDPARPAGIFLFVGPTGTGKTELARALADSAFDGAGRLVRIDMSEYMERHAVSRLLGAPPGYIGHDEEGQLTSLVRTNPSCVVLFDEIEKAHPEVLDILLQIFDAGRLTDSHGRVVSFNEAFIVMTSNLGTSAEQRRQPIGFARNDGPHPNAEEDQRIREALREALRPELLNRIADIVVFTPLSVPSVRRIIGTLAEKLTERLSEKSLHIELTAAATDVILRAGYDLTFGARHLERAFDRLLTRPLASALIQQRFPAGALIVVDADERGIVFSEAAVGQRAAPRESGE